MQRQNTPDAPSGSPASAQATSPDTQARDVPAGQSPPQRRADDRRAAESTRAEAEMILVMARARAPIEGLSYAGAVTPREAFRLHELGAAIIVDVRTPAEHKFVGRIEGSVLVPWQFDVPGERNPGFLAQLATQARPDDVILLLCRSAKRSHAAAQLLAERGWPNAFNILEGFEGDLNAVGRRGTTEGWRFHGLPWVQS